MFKKFWLALWWWAARWFAHVWVIKYFEEIWLKASEISWTSMWSIVASFYAFWFKTTEIINIISKIKKLDYIKLIDLNFKTWLIWWIKIKKKLEDIFWNVKIEQAKIPLKIISVNIDTWEKKVFDKWLLIDAIRSSISIPFIISPYNIKKDNLIDWWVINNLPIEELKSKNIIAVSVLRDIKRQINKETKFLWFKIKHNLIWLNYQILQKTIDIMMKQNEDRSLKCKNKNILFINPKFPNIDYYEFYKFNEIIDIWYNECKRVIWKI